MLDQRCASRVWVLGWVLWVVLCAGCGDDGAPRSLGADDVGVTDAGGDEGDAREDSSTESDAREDEGDSDDGGVEETCGAPVSAPPLETPEGEWAWVPVQGMRCANGEPTGIGVNLAPGGSKRVVVYFIGGGACWDAASCYTRGRAAFVEEGFTEETFAEGAGAEGHPFLDRSVPQNPFSDHHMIFVPYCTGDIHAGDRVATYAGRETHHVGAANVEALIARVAATAPDAERVVLTGSSAGGFGALLNWHRVRAAFPCARVDAISDGAAPIPQPEFPPARRDQWANAWGLAATMPDGCPECVADWWRLVPYNLDAQRHARGAILTAVRDEVIAGFMEIDGATLEAGVAHMMALAEHPRFGAFLIPGDEHVIINTPARAANGQSIKDWVEAMQADDVAWASTGPDGVEIEAPDCAAAEDCGACAVCSVEDTCAAPFAACNDDPCVEATVCALGCDADDAACIDGCLDGARRDAATALYACVRCEACGDVCGVCPGD